MYHCYCGNSVGVPDVETVSCTSLSVGAPTKLAELYFNISPRDTTDTAVSVDNVPSATALFHRKQMNNLSI